MPDIHINNHGVEQLLTDLDPNKATGPDGMPACILKILYYTILLYYKAFI